MQTQTFTKASAVFMIVYILTDVSPVHSAQQTNASSIKHYTPTTVALTKAPHKRKKQKEVFKQPSEIFNYLLSLYEGLQSDEEKYTDIAIGSPWIALRCIFIKRTMLTKKANKATEGMSTLVGVDNSFLELASGRKQAEDDEVSLYTLIMYMFFKTRKRSSRMKLVYHYETYEEAHKKGLSDKVLSYCWLALLQSHAIQMVYYRNEYFAKLFRQITSVGFQESSRRKALYTMGSKKDDLKVISLCPQFWAKLLPVRKALHQSMSQEIKNEQCVAKFTKLIMLFVTGVETPQRWEKYVSIAQPDQKLTKSDDLFTGLKAYTTHFGDQVEVPVPHLPNDCLSHIKGSRKHRYRFIPDTDKMVRETWAYFDIFTFSRYVADRPIWKLIFEDGFTDRHFQSLEWSIKMDIINVHKSETKRIQQIQNSYAKEIRTQQLGFFIALLGIFAKEALATSAK